MRALDANEIAVLENRAGAIGDVEQHRSQPSATAQTPPRIKCLQQSLRGRTSRLTCIGQSGDGIEFGRGAARDIKRGFVVPHPRWADVPQNPLLKAHKVVDADSCGLGQFRPVSRDSDMDGRRFTSQGRFEAQGSRSRVKHCGPSALRPGQRSGVVDVHAQVDPCPLIASEQSPDLVLPQASVKGLLTRDQPVLLTEHIADVHLLDTRGQPRRRPEAFRGPVDNRLCRVRLRVACRRLRCRRHRCGRGFLDRRGGRCHGLGDGVSRGRNHRSCGGDRCGRGRCRRRGGRGRRRGVRREQLHQGVDDQGRDDCAHRAHADQCGGLAVPGNGLRSGWRGRLGVLAVAGGVLSGLVVVVIVRHAPMVGGFSRPAADTTCVSRWCAVGGASWWGTRRSRRCPTASS